MCDAVMGIPYGNREELTTQPYYVSSYVFVFKKSRKYDIKSMDSPVLRKLKIGLEGETPVEDGVKIRGMLDRTTIFDVGSTSGLSPATMLDALDKGQIDVLMTWEPAIGFFLNRYADLEVVAVPNTRTLGSPEQYVFPMSMGVRQGDEALKKRLDQVIAESPGGAHSDLDAARRPVVYAVGSPSNVRPQGGPIRLKRIPQVWRQHLSHRRSLHRPDVRRAFDPTGAGRPRDRRLATRGMANG